MTSAPLQSVIFYALNNSVIWLNCFDEWHHSDRWGMLKRRTITIHRRNLCSDFSSIKARSL